MLQNPKQTVQTKTHKLKTKPIRISVFSIGREKSLISPLPRVLGFILIPSNPKNETVQYYIFIQKSIKNFQNFKKMNLSMDEIRQILSEVLKLLATPEFQTQLEKSRQSSANDAVALLQSVRFFNYRCCGFSHKKSHSLERILMELRDINSAG